MESAWRSAGVQLGKHWKWVLLGALAFTAVLFYGLTQLQFATGQDSYLNSDSQVALDNVAFQDQFGGETAILLFQADEGKDVTDLLAGPNFAEMQRITDELSQIPEVSSVVTPLVSLTFSDALVKGPGRQALLAASGRDEDPAGQAARSADIGIGLGRVGEFSADEQTLDNEAWVEVLVFSNEGFADNEAGELVAPTGDDRVIRSSLAGTFPDHRTAVGGVILKGNASLDELAAGTDAVLKIAETINLEGFAVTTTGSPVYLREINDYLKGGMVKLGLAALAVMAVILALLFKVRWRLLPLVSVVFGVAWAFSILGYVGIDLSLVTIAGLPILIGLGIDFAIQIHNRVEEEVVLDRAEHPMSETLANMGPALVVATVGAILAFLALRISQVPMIRDFGVMLAIGVAFLLLAGIVLPTAVLGIREWTGRTGEREESAVERLVVWLGSMPSKLGPILVGLAAVLFVVGVLTERDVKIESDPVRWIDQSSQTVADIDLLTAETGFASTLGILVEANNVLDSDVNQLLWDFTLAAEARPEVISSSSLVNTMGKIINFDGASNLAPTAKELSEAAAVMPPDIARALLSEDGTATQVNLRLAQASLEQRAVLVAELETDLAARIAALELPADSILLVDNAAGQAPVKAVPSGLAVVGVGLLENLSSNRTVLTYLGLALVGLWLVLRHRSIVRALLALVPVLLAVGVSAIIVGAFGLTLSPLTTVGGPLVIATCTEFSALILARYLEERQRGLEPKAATDTASARTGRAFFTSAATTIGGFAVLIGSSLPLLRDFGIIVTMNVAVALLAALVVLPPLLVWADEKGLLTTKQKEGAVQLAATERRELVGTAIGTVVLAACAVGFFLAADKTEGTADAAEYSAIAIPTTTLPPPPPTTTTEAPDEPVPTTTIDIGQFGETPPEGAVSAALFGFLVDDAGVEPQRAVCVAETLFSRTTEAELLANPEFLQFTDAAVEPVVLAAKDCGVTDRQIDLVLASARGEEPPPEDETPTTTEPVPTTIDLGQYGDTPPEGTISPVLFAFLVDDAGVEPQRAVCTIETLYSGYTDEELLAIPDFLLFTDEAVEPVVAAAESCGVTDDQVAAVLTAARGG